eukprot:13347822-Alexandrium_andersonii.AAC.1
MAKSCGRSWWRACLESGCSSGRLGEVWQAPGCCGNGTRQHLIARGTWSPRSVIIFVPCVRCPWRC